MALAAVMLMVTSGAEAQGPLDDKLAIHGFLTQGFARSDAMPVLGVPVGFTTDYRTAAIQSRYEVGEHGTAIVQANVVVVVHASNPTGALTKDEVSRIFLKRQTRWPNDASTAPVDLDARSDVKEQFVRRFHGRSLDGLDSYWQQQIFSGRETPPTVRSSDAEVIAFVAEVPGAIGYVSDAARLPATVRVLQVKVK